MCDENKELEYEDVEVEVYDVPMEDGTVAPFALVDEFEIDDQPYVVLCPIEEDNTIAEEPYYFRKTIEGDEEVMEPVTAADELMWCEYAYKDLFEEDMESEEETEEE